MKVRLVYPVVCFNEIILDMTEDEFEELKAKPMEDQAKFICEQDKKLAVPYNVDETNIYHALDVDYARIGRVVNEIID